MAETPPRGPATTGTGGPEQLLASATRHASEDSTTHTAVAPAFEDRDIVVAQGIEFHNSCYLAEVDWNLPQAIRRKPDPDWTKVEWRSLDKLIINADNTAEYTNDKQRVHYRVRIIEKKDDFKLALETPGLMVIYDGHARYGRGPCFGDPAKHTFNSRGYPECPPKGEDWGDGSATSVWGQWKMGFPWIPVPVSEMLHHGYRALAVLEDKPVNLSKTSARRHPDIRLSGLEPTALKKLIEETSARRHPDIRLSRLKLMTLDELIDETNRTRDRLRTAVAKFNADPEDDIPEELQGIYHKDASNIRGQFTNVTDTSRFWVQHVNVYFRKADQWYRLREVILDAGWSGTNISPMDLGGTVMRCRCFCHFGCSTYKHNHPIVRGSKYANWRQEGNERYAYWTDKLSASGTSAFWMYNIFRYSKRSAKLSWAPLLADAVKKTNDDLLRCREKYKVVS